jgi:hypothetical protein
LLQISHRGNGDPDRAAFGILFQTGKPELSILDFMSPGERTRPVMEYVRHLENRVREYRNTEMRFRGRWFTFGFLAGVAAAFAAGWVR